MPRDKYDSPNPRRTHTFMSAEDVAAGKKSTWTELEITGENIYRTYINNKKMRTFRMEYISIFLHVTMFALMLNTGGHFGTLK